MIAQIYGKVIEKNENSLILDVNGISYQVLVPKTVLNRIEENLDKDRNIRLITYHYHSLEPARSTPVLIGFLNNVEKEFFENFITVSGIGPRAAIKALIKPISQIAKAIDEGDTDLLKLLPGIGERKAKEIVAKLQGRVGKFGLIRDKEIAEVKEDIKAETIQVLLQLQYKKSEAKEMIEKALKRRPDIKTTEELLNEIYRERKKPETSN